MSEEDIILIAASRGWQAEIDYIRMSEGIKAIFLTQGRKQHILQPLRAILFWNDAKLINYLDQLENH